MNEYVIETVGLTRRFKQLTAVNGVNLNVSPGSIYGFLGPNGAGKTTTIRMLLGLIRPTAGKVQLLGVPVPEKRYRVLNQIGSLVEAPALYPHLTGRENLEVIRHLRNGTKTQISRALGIVNLEKDADRIVSQYSQGMCQRLGLAIALLSEPQLLILDEPTNGLDPAGIHEIRELIQRLPGEHGVTVFVSSHLLSEVEQMATHIGIIQSGRLIFQGTPEELRARYQDHIALKVDQPEIGQLMLRGMGWQVAHNGNHTLRIDANGEADAALVTTQLVKSGLKVYHVALEQPSLEDIFLQLTKTEDKEGISK